MKSATFFVILFIASFAYPMETNETESTTETIVVSGNLVTPFVQNPKFQHDAGKYEGFTIDYLNALFNELNMKYSFEKNSLQDTLEKVKNGEARIGASAISITSQRESNGLDFVPYFNSGLGIMVNEVDKTSNIPKLIELASNVVIVLIIYILVSAHLIWLCEQGTGKQSVNLNLKLKELVKKRVEMLDDENGKYKPSQIQALSDEIDELRSEINSLSVCFNDQYFPGIFEGMWWCVVTMSTVGYGDKVPQKWLGKNFGVLTIFFGIVMFGWVLTSWDTINGQTLEYQINSPMDLNGKKVAVKANTTGEDASRKFGAVIQPVDIADQGYFMLRDGEVDAVVYDWPVMTYYALNSGAGYVHVGKDMFDKQSYGLAFKEGDPLQEKVKRAHLRIVENGVYENIYRKYFNGF